MDDLKIIESGGFGISKVNEIFALKKIIKFYIGKRLIESKMQKRFRAKDQNKDDVLQEDLDNDSECTIDDETEE